MDVGYPRTISPNWGWGSFGANGIDAALYSGSKCYFFAGGEYIRVTRGVTGPGTIDPGYPRPIAPNWGWGAFGANGIDAALYSNSKCYFFSGKEYIRVTRGETGPARWTRGIHDRSRCGAGAHSAPMVLMLRCIAGRAAISFLAISTYFETASASGTRTAASDPEKTRSKNRVVEYSCLIPRRSADTEASLPARIEDRGDESTS